MSYAISKGMILGLSSNQDVYLRGEKYYRAGKILSVKQLQSDGAHIVQMQVEGNYKDYNLTLTFDTAGSLLNYTCECESHQIWRGACKHVVAGLFSLMNGKYTKSEGPKAYAASRALTEAVEKQIFDEIDEYFDARNNETGTVELTPLLLLDKNEARFELKIGELRQYVLKNIHGLIDDIDNRQTVSYGNKFTFVHNRAAFTEEARKLLDFLRAERDFHNEASAEIMKSHYMYIQKTSGRFKLLTERNMDNFFGLYEGREIEAQIHGAGRKTSLAVVNGPPPFKYGLEFTEETGIMRGAKHDYFEYEGREFTYFALGPAIYRTVKKDGRIISSLQKTFNEAAGGEIRFSGAEYGKLLSVLAPRMQRLGVIDGITGEAPAVVASKLTSKYYFELEDKNILCRLEFIYDSLQNGEDAPVTERVAGDAAEEYKASKRLVSLGFIKENGHYLLTGDELVYEFIRTGMDGLRDSGEVYVTDELRLKAVKNPVIQIGLRLSGDLLDISVDSRDYSLADLLEALESVRARKKFHRLKDGRYLDLEDDGVRSAADMLIAMDLSKRDVADGAVRLPKNRAVYLDSLTRGSAGVSRDSYFEKLVADFAKTGETDFPIPNELANTLREYQKTGFKWLKVLTHYGFGGILADDMGLGKTLQIISLFVSHKNERGQNALPGPFALVVAPTSLIYNWENEILKFAPDLSSAVISGLPEKRRELLKQEADVFITTYDMLKRDTDNYEGMEFAFLIADEAQNIKNPATQNAKSVKHILARNKFALTGTPVENSLSELWSIFDFIMPGYLHSANKFEKLYETAIVKHNNRQRAEMLQKQVKPFLLRRLKKDVLTELPEKTETCLFAELNPEQRKLYQAQLMRSRGELDQILGAGLDTGRIKILSLLLQLRQICCHPTLLYDNYVGGSGKLALALDTIQMVLESGHRILVFSQFTSMLALIRKELDSSVFRYFYLDGATPSKERTVMAKAFNGGERDLFLISLKAGGTGLNLTGADVVMHFDPWWNPAVMDQASDRAHRYGQKRAVQVFQLIAKDTIEEKIILLHGKKKNLIDSVITQGEKFITGMSEEEIRELFAV